MHFGDIIAPLWANYKTPFESKSYLMSVLFTSHLDLAHHYWAQVVQKGDTVIDATYGKDTLALAKLALNENQGHLIGLDIQKEALGRTKQLLIRHLPSEWIQSDDLEQSHVDFPHAAG